MTDLYIEVTALKVKNCGSQFSSDQVVFKCPYCKRRNKQNIRRSVERLQSEKVAAFRCVCGHLVFVRKPVSIPTLVLPGQSAHISNRLALAGAAVDAAGQGGPARVHGQSLIEVAR